MKQLLILATFTASLAAAHPNITITSEGGPQIHNYYPGNDEIRIINNFGPNEISRPPAISPYKEFPLPAQSHHFNPQGKITIHTTAGSIEVNAEPNLQKIIIEPTKFALPDYDNNVTPIINIYKDSASLGEKSEQICVNLGSCSVCKSAGYISYKIKVPAQAVIEGQSRSGNITINNNQGSIKVESRSGNITINNSEGSISATNRVGNITATLIKLLKPIQLRTRSGTCNLTLPKNSDATVNISTRNGNVWTKLNNITLRRNNSFQLGRGTHSVDVSTRSGNINISTK